MTMGPRILQESFWFCRRCPFHPCAWLRCYGHRLPVSTATMPTSAAALGEHAEAISTVNLWAILPRLPPPLVFLHTWWVFE